MAPTAETVARHELVGLPTRVADAADAGTAGVAGRIVGETTNTLSIAAGDDVRQVPKEGATFAVGLPAADGRETATTVRIDGSRLVARPARRTERTGDSRWR